jgi:hypothetical protein
MHFWKIREVANSVLSLLPALLPRQALASSSSPLFPETSALTMSTTTTETTTAADGTTTTTTTTTITAAAAPTESLAPTGGVADTPFIAIVRVRAQEGKIQAFKDWYAVVDGKVDESEVGMLNHLLVQEEGADPHEIREKQIGRGFRGLT